MGCFVVLFCALLSRLCGSIVTNITITDKLTIWLYAPNIVRVTTLPSTVIELPSATSRVVTYTPSQPIPFTMFNPNINTVVIKTSKIQIYCNKSSNMVAFYDIADTEMKSAILTESNKTFTPIIDTATNDTVYNVLQEWILSNTTKALYGWGEYQNGFTNYIGSTVRCIQFNTEACIPMLITNDAYGIYWDNYGVSTLNSIHTKAEPSDIITAKDISYADTIYGDESKTVTECTWHNFTISFSASNKDGDRYFFSHFNNWTSWGAQKSGGQFYLEFYIERSNAGPQLIEIFNYSNNIPASLAMQPVQMTANEKVIIYLNYQCFDAVPNVFYREPQSQFDIAANEAFYIDYYFIYSAASQYKSPINTASLDGVIAGYRLLTGAAPLYELSAYGFWQCKQHYASQSEVLEVATAYRDKHLSVDGIVQDWMYWGGTQNWGPQWDLTQYPDPKQMVHELHNLSFYFMVSVHSKFGSNATCLKYLHQQENITNNVEIIAATIGTTFEWFDPYNIEAQDDYYACIKKTMFDIGVDAIWSDGSEPAKYPNYNALYDNGRYSANMLFNTYSLQVLEALQRGLNRDQPNKRIFDLTRSSFAGQSKTGGAVWSGDITSSYDTLRRQITASLSTQSAGNPYWSQDIGGFFRPSCNYQCWWYLQLLIRWFQFGAFVPIFRVHGNGVNTSYWNYGPIVLQDVALIDDLRYRLLPYIYSCAYYVTQYSYTIQRALIFDYYDDENVFNKSSATQFMFGPYLLISPVFRYDNKTDIYLPKKYKQWYDFWSGEIVKGATYMKNVVVPLQQIPIHVHEGSILIMGPFSEWANEYYPWNELEVRIYSGCDASFIYFNDDGKDRFSLKNNEFVTILFEWKETNQELVVGQRIGKYHYMQTQIKLNIVLVSKEHGVGVNITQNPDKSIIYNGSQIIIQLREYSH